MEITVYSTATCSKCKVFKRKLDERGIDYFDIQDEEKVLNLAQNLNISTVPIIEIDGIIYNEKDALKKLGL